MRCNKKGILCIILCILLLICGEYHVFGATIHDVRALLKLESPEALYTEDEMQSIIDAYTLDTLAAIDEALRKIENGEGVTEIYDEDRVALLDVVNLQREAFNDAFIACEPVEIVKSRKNELSNSIAKLDMLKNYGYEIDYEVRESTFSKDYENVIKYQESLKEGNIGVVGSGLNAPVSGGKFIIKSLYGMRKSSSDALTMHIGLDLEANSDDRVLALWNGVVSNIYTTDQTGLTMELQHYGGLKTRYTHLSKTLLNKGDIVTQYQEIGVPGQSSNALEGMCVHFEVYVDDKVVNPILLFGTNGVNALNEWLKSHPDDYITIQNMLSVINERVIGEVIKPLTDIKDRTHVDSLQDDEALQKAKEKGIIPNPLEPVEIGITQGVPKDILNISENSPTNMN